MLGSRQDFLYRRTMRALPESLLPSNRPSAAGVARRLALRLLDTVLPPRCLSCSALVATTGSLCGGCWRDVDFLGHPFCAICGWPFAFEHGEGALCAACTARRPSYDRARAVLRYHEHSRRLILSFKHGDRLDAAPAFGAWMARAAGDMLTDCDLVTPVPLHRLRLFTRRYNQSALLAHALSREGGVALGVDVLVRVRATPSQGGLSRNERYRNVRGAFTARPSRRALVEGRKVLLVDDVMTTGATVEACARALRKAGARRVDVLTLARVVHPAQLS